MFIVVNAVDGSINQIELFINKESALGFAVELAKEQCDNSEDDIRAELTNSVNTFFSYLNNIEIRIFEKEVK